MTDDRRVSSTECRRGTMEPSTTNVKKEADNGNVVIHCYLLFCVTCEIFC